jgi:hypothetical protein
VVVGHQVGEEPGSMEKLAAVGVLGAAKGKSRGEGPAWSAPMEKKASTLAVLGGEGSPWAAKGVAGGYCYREGGDNGECVRERKKGEERVAPRGVDGKFPNLQGRVLLLIEEILGLGFQIGQMGWNGLVQNPKPATLFISRKKMLLQNSSVRKIE